MSSEPPPGSGQQPPDDDPFRKQPPPSGGPGSPYDDQPPYGGQAPPPPPPGGPYGGGPYGGDPYGGGGPPADPLAGMPPLAPSGRRTLARVLDMILVGVVVWLLSWGFGVTEFNTDNVQYGKSVVQSLIAAVLFIGYDTVLIARTGQTLGMRLLTMRVANLDDGATPSAQTSLIRAAVLWIPFAFCCACVWTAIAGGWSYFDRPYKQGLHDKAAKTVVVSTEG
ncbi:integral membrane protein [Streptomyces zinciresistens K42]|uniref:Integral membrane protein n=1 Tax=Streptomyces zinciresistens K42 TaxID=700597 RepID=G2GL67_9ACTN|nr:RDD family protein [Streptomyces zinciresistens]EGX55760.1 integral membrane protein [Streptomyces zinciresistens K42]